MLGLSNKQLCYPCSPTCVCSEHHLFCFPCSVWNVHWWVARPAGDNILAQGEGTPYPHLARLVRGFIDAGSAGRKAVSQPAPPRGAFPVSLRWSHHYSQVITGPVTWLLLQDCHPWHPSSAHRAWERAPSAGTDRAVSKCKTDILMTWKRGCSLSPPYSLSKLVTAPMRSHFHVSLCFLFMKYHSGFLSVDSRFLEALCLHFKGTQR